MNPINKDGAVTEAMSALQSYASQAQVSVEDLMREVLAKQAAEQPQKKKIRLVFYGDAPPVATGFGKVSSNILGPLAATGKYDVSVFGVNYMGVPHPYPFQIYPMLPNPQGDPYGREKIQQVLPHMEFDIVFFLQDSFILEFIPNVIHKMKSMGKQFKSVVYFPVDGTPRESWIRAMSAADVSVTYTNWGKKMCSSIYPDIEEKLLVIPHGISLREFFPHPPDKRAQLRKMYFSQHADKFIIINVNRNQQRKDIPRTLMAYKEFKKSCPNSLYYLHCAEKDVGWDLPKVAENLGLVVGEDIMFPPNFNVNMGVPVSIVNDLYNCADVCISAAVGEGWGLSSVEAMATKTPCIFPDNTSLTEIFADGRGFLCRSGGTPNFHTVMPMDNEVVRPLMNVTDLVKYLKRLYEKPEVGHKMADKAFQWVKKELQWEKTIVPRFDQIFTDLYEDLERTKHTQAEAPRQPEKDNEWRRGEIV